MVKKSNKTEHVLKLITKNDEEQEDNLFGIESAAEIKVKSPAVEIKIEAPPVPAAPAKLEPIVPLQEVETPPAGEAKPEPAGETKPAPAGETKPEPPVMKAFREQKNSHTAVLQQNGGLVNIAELVAREKIGVVMERMKVCTCSTCVNDVLALTLNSLPTKYIAADAVKQNFQFGFYKDKYEMDILAALAKACVRVKAAPRHE